jgi:hypothetical protein
MRSLPAGWPSPSSPLQTAPVVYLHVVAGAWPPASVQDGESLPDGWTRVGQWQIDADLDAPLMPGQVNAGTKFTVASGSCTIPQPRGGMLAPWRAKKERTPKAGACELWASFDGYNGSTKFLLGNFILDPVSGKASEPFLTLTFVQDLVRLRKPHDLPSQIVNPPLTDFAFANPVSPTRYLEIAAANNGYTLVTTADFTSRVTSSYLPGTMDELTAIQTIVGANLGAVFQTMDGAKIRVLTADDLLGQGTILATMNVVDSFEDLAWTQDPNASVDRVEVTFIPPSYAGGITLKTIADQKSFGTTATDAAFAYFDPGTAILPDGAQTGTLNVIGPNGPETATVYVFQRSSGAVALGLAVSSPGSYKVNGKQTVTAFGNVSGADDAVTLAWGESTVNATNTLTFDLGPMIQRRSDAIDILNRIVTRVTSGTYVVEDVKVVPDLRRELGDLLRIDFPEAGLRTRALVTGVKLSGTPGGIEQSLTIAALGLTLTDFDAAWDAVNPTATINTFDAAWDAALPGATVDDFDTDPLKTT